MASMIDPTSYPHPDVAELLYHVRCVERGEMLYRDLFTHHFPGWYAFVFALDRVVRIDPSVLPLLAAALMLLSAVLLQRILSEAGRPEAGFLAAFIHLTLGWVPGWGGMQLGNQATAQPILILFLFILQRCALRGTLAWAFYAGLAGGALAVWDQRLTVFLPLLLLFRKQREGRMLASAAIGAMVLPALAASWLSAHGAVGAFVDETLRFPLQYRNAAATAGPLSVAAELFSAAFQAEPAFSIVGIAAFALVFFLGRHARDLRLLVLSSALCALAYAFIGGRAFVNYAVVFAPLFVLAASAAEGTLARLSSRAGAAWSACLCVMALCTLLSPYLLHRVTGRWYFVLNHDAQKAAAAYVDERMSASDDMLVWGYAPQIYLYADRFSRFKDIGLLSITGANFQSSRSEEQGYVPTMVSEFAAYLRNSPPRFILLFFGRSSRCESYCQQPNWRFDLLTHLRFFADVFERDYRPAAEFEDGAVQVKVYERAAEITS